MLTSQYTLLLKIAGRMAFAAKLACATHPLDLSARLNELERVVDDYDQAVLNFKPSPVPNAINFGRWVVERGWRIDPNEGWFRECEDQLTPRYDVEYTDEMVWQLFLEDAGNAPAAINETETDAIIKSVEARAKWDEQWIAIGKVVLDIVKRIK